MLVAKCAYPNILVVFHEHSSINEGVTWVLRKFEKRPALADLGVS